MLAVCNIVWHWQIGISLQVGQLECIHPMDLVLTLSTDCIGCHRCYRRVERLSLLLHNIYFTYSHRGI